VRLNDLLKENGIALFIDFKGAYDSLRRDKLQEIFQKRFSAEGWSLKLLSDLLKPQEVQIGDLSFTADGGVA
jgi:hypothetical protein